MFARGLKTSRKVLAAVIAVSATSALVATPTVLAQETTAEVRGVVIDTSGVPLEGATIMVTSKATGISKTVEANASGGYSIRGLPAGVIYDIEVMAEGLQKSSTKNVSLAVGQSAVLNYNLSAIEEVVVIGTQVVVAQTAVGPNAIFDIAALQDSPAINRNINDIIQQDPRLYVDQSRGSVDAVQCNGCLLYTSPSPRDA